MIQPWITVLVAISYISVLFVVASYGDRVRSFGKYYNASRPNIYALSLAIYCTTWTFFGSVGLASTSGLDFLAIYVGPVLVVTLFFPLLKRIVKLSKQERITSVADFLGSRYGKNNKVAAVAAIIAVIGTIPYIALQLKAISRSVDTLLIEFNNGFPSATAPFGDITLFVTAILALFAVLFGTRHADATEHQHGLMLAIAMESVIKLIAFLAVGIFVTWFMFGGVSDLFAQAAENPNVQDIVYKGFSFNNFLILTFLSLSVFILLPRQFHVAVVENTSDKELNRARWLFPAYLIAINLFVIPIAIAGTLKFGIAANADDFVLLLPILEEQRALGLLVFIGGLSAGTAMVIVASVALAIMISNDLILPLILRSGATFGHSDPSDMERRILNIRRTSIFAVLALGYFYYELADNTAALASIGLVSFSAIAQLAPAFFIGLFWKGANARGAMLGMTAGFAVWAYCLLLPTLLPESSPFVTQGLFGNILLKPENLFGLGLDPLANGVIWSMAANTLVFIFGSVSRHSDPQEKLQAALFVSYQTSPYNSIMITKGAHVPIEELQTTLSRYLGSERTARAFESYWQSKPQTLHSYSVVDDEVLHFSEQLLASAVGASSSRLIHSLLIKRNDKTNFNDLELLDQASRAVQFNRDVLQTAIDQLEQGITVFDGSFRLASWNRQFRQILNLPDAMGQAGIPLNEVAKEIVQQNGLEGNDPAGQMLANRLVNSSGVWQLNLPQAEQVLEIRTSPMPEGGSVITWNNITQRVRAAEALRDANETLERRVEERTVALKEAREVAVQANVSKTRFLAAAGHDILQPLNAARLYSATLTERMVDGRNVELADNIGRSLGSVEEILSSILAISRLDTANPEVNIVDFPLQKITEQLEIEFEPVAAQQNLELVFVHSSKWITSDPALLKRLLQNLISNSLKFTPGGGKVVFGCRSNGDDLTLEVIDSGIGMNSEEQKIVFSEFTRLNTMADKAPGLGLGLSIVERIANLLDHSVELNSQTDKGTRFQILVAKAIPTESLLEAYTPRRQAVPGQLSGLHVLCIDNEPAILEGMKALLTQWGCDVFCAEGEDEARKILKDAEQLPDVVLIDYHLENKTGIDVFDMLCEHCEFQFPAALITADRTEHVKQLAQNSGMALLNKPLKPAALRAFISQYHMRRHAAE